MAGTLSVWKFESVDGAEKAEQVLLDLQAEGAVRVDDAAVISWDIDAKRPRTRQLNTTIGAGALAGSFWGFLFGLIFFMPLLGAAVGAASGAAGGALTDIGIDDGFIDKIRSRVTPGTSALFALTSEAVVDRVADAFRDMSAELIQTNLDHDDEARMREVFGA